MPERRASIMNFIVIAVPCLVYAIHALQFGSWVVDDAGITFAYSRHFAQGYGLVSQPGMPPVEGYSNFIWLVLLAPFFLVNSFDPVITPKIISFLLVAGTFLALYGVLKPLPGHRWIALTAFTLTTLNTSFVVWTISGLENALYIFLVAVMLWWSLRILFDGAATPHNVLALGVLAALTGMTRPEGLAYILAFPVILLPARKISWKQKGTLLLVYGAGFALTYGAFILFRLSYFGAPLPNTYYMKGGPKLDDVLDLLTLQTSMIEKAQRLLKSAVAVLNDLLPFVLAAGILYLLVARRWTGRAWGVLVYLLCSLSLYLLLPPDWMGEYRFATVFFPLLYLFSFLMVGLILNQLPSLLSLATQVALSALTIFAAVGLFSPRSEAFSRNPTVPFQTVKTEYADKFDWYKQMLNLESASVMLPDVGGTLYYSAVRVYDLAGLTDQTVARYLGQHIYRPGFYEYVFETTRPTFIHTHGFWTHHARLEDDPRFVQEYVPICAYIDPYVEQNYRVKRQSGDFILRSIAETRPNELGLIRQALDDNCKLK
jgi:hypothetical protein